MAVRMGIKGGDRGWGLGLSLTVVWVGNPVGSQAPPPGMTERDNRLIGRCRPDSVYGLGVYLHTPHSGLC